MRKVVFIAFAALIILFFGMAAAVFPAVISSGMVNDVSGNTGQDLSEEVLSYRPLVLYYAEKYGISEYLDYLLAIMQVESGGKGSDVMQSSESLGLPPGTLEPEESIEQGCRYFSLILGRAEAYGCDIDTVVQAYNYGIGFTDYVYHNGGLYTFELAVAFAEEKSGGEKVAYDDPVAIRINGGWKYKYGSMFYVPHVMAYLPLECIADETVQAVFNEALKYEGWTYVWGGDRPSTGFDCSGLVQWCYGTAGISLPRTAQGQYDAAVQHLTLEDAEPGDLVFFQGTYETDVFITHVGIYVGNYKMYHAGDPIGYTDLTDVYWQEHFVCVGRIKK